MIHPLKTMFDKFLKEVGYFSAVVSFLRKGMKSFPAGMTSMLGQANEALRSDMQQRTENLFFL